MHLIVGQPRLERQPPQPLAEDVEREVLRAGFGLEDLRVAEADAVGRDVEFDLATLPRRLLQPRGDIGDGGLERRRIAVDERRRVANALEHFAHALERAVFIAGPCRQTVTSPEPGQER